MMNDNGEHLVSPLSAEVLVLMVLVLSWSRFVWSWYQFVKPVVTVETLLNWQDWAAVDI